MITSRKFWKPVVGVGAMLLAGLSAWGDGLQYVDQLTQHSSWCSSARNTRFGLSVATGDFDDDGFLDLVVSSQADLYVYYGTGNASFDSPGTALDIAGAYVATADINGDGIDDLVTGDTSDVAAWHGGPVRFPDSLSWASADWRVRVDTTSWTRTLVANAGDISGDGIDDIVVGLPDAGPKAFVLHGFDSGSAAAPNGPRNILYAEFLRALQNPGDVDGDGRDDYIYTVDLGLAQPQVRVSLVPYASTALASGLNNRGQLGDGTQTNRSSLVQAGAAGDWIAISSSGSHTTAIAADGTVWAWGDNTYGQLGDGTTTASSVPVQAGSDADWATVSGGFAHTMAIKSDGTLWGWGWNGHGTIGDGTTVDRHVPTAVGSDTDWTAVATGFYYTLALKSDGTLWAWGRNDSGQLGHGHTTTVSTPTKIGFDSDWVAVDAGDKHSLALKSDGTMWAWGRNGEGELGDGTTTDSLVPIRSGTAYSDWTAIGAGIYHNLALRADGSLWAWGANWYGEIGDGTTIDRYVPTRVGSATNWATIDGGGFHSAALTMSGELYTWGANSSGQLGDGTTIERHAPHRVGTGRDWLAVSLGSHHILGLEDARAFDWSVEGLSGVSSSWFGQVVGSAGDINGDGFADVYVADPWHDGNPGSPGHLGDWGRFYVWFGGSPGAGNPTGLGGSETIFTADEIFDGNYADSAMFGTAHASGDLDGDGFDDLVVGDPRGADWCFDDNDQQSVEETGLVKIYVSLGPTDDDFDGHAAGDDCDDSNPAIYPGAQQACDGINNDCDDPQWPAVPATEIDNDSDGLAECAGDCNDLNADVGPGRTEICDTVDNNCDGLTDEGFDPDGDGVAACLDGCPDVHDPGQPAPRALVTLAGSGALSWIDLISGALIPVATGYDGPTGVAVNSDNTMAYFAEAGTGRLVALDLFTGSSPYKISGLGLVESVAVDSSESYAYVASRDLGQLLKVELRVLGSVAVVASGLSGPAGVVLNADEKIAYVTEMDSGELSSVNLSSGSVTLRAVGLQQPAGLDLDSAGTTAYVAEFGGGRLSSVDLTSGAVTPVRSNLGFIRDVALNEAETTAYITRTGSPIMQGRGYLNAVDLGTGVSRVVAAWLNQAFGLVLQDPECAENVCNDADGDGFGTPGVTACPGGVLPDCDDADATSFPGSPELCDGVDNDCDGFTDVTESDADADGYRICAGDCDDGDRNTYPDASEVNDGRDNQCPGEPGHGAVDEVSGTSVAGPTGEICWPEQPGATLYEIAYSDDPSFASSCTSVIVDTPCYTDPVAPPSGAAEYYLIRTLLPLVGSWGQNVSGAERVVACAGELACRNGADDDFDGWADCDDPDCMGDAACQARVFSFYDRPIDDISSTALESFFSSLAPSPSDYMFFEIRSNTSTDGAWCAERADFYVDTYLDPPPPVKGVSTAVSDAWNKWSSPQSGPWSAPTTQGFTNRYGPTWWDSEIGLGGLRLSIAPDGTGSCEAADENQLCDDFANRQSGTLTIRVGPSRLATCGF